MVDGPELLRIGIGGVVPVQWSLEKSEEETGTLTGWASVYNVVDQQDDVVVPGAFRKTIAEWRTSKRVIPLTLDHQNTAEGVIGSLVKVEDSAYGLKTTFKFSSSADAQAARTKAREGHLNGLSIFGPIFDKAFDNVAGKSVRVLKQVGLAFVGLTPMPANTGSLVLAAKGPAAEEQAVVSLPENWVADMQSALAIAIPEARKAAVDVLVKNHYGTVLDPPKAAEQQAAPSGHGDADAASKYALDLVGESPSAPGDPVEDLLALADQVQTSTDIDALEKELNGS